MIRCSRLQKVGIAAPKPASLVPLWNPTGRDQLLYVLDFKANIRDRLGLFAVGSLRKARVSDNLAPILGGYLTGPSAFNTRSGLRDHLRYPLHNRFGSILSIRHLIAFLPCGTIAFVTWL